MTSTEKELLSNFVTVKQVPFTETESPILNESANGTDSKVNTAESVAISMLATLPMLSTKPVNI
jgi:hypothetical protein